MTFKDWLTYLWFGAVIVYVVGLVVVLIAAAIDDRWGG